MRRLAASIAAAAVLVASAAFGLSALLPREAIAARAAQELRALVGREVTIGETRLLRLLPAPKVAFTKVAVAGLSPRDPPLLVAPRLEAELRLLPLAAGIVEMRSFRLAGPHLSLAIDERGRPNWLLPRSAVLYRYAAARDAAIGSVAVEGGSVSFRDARSGFAETAEAVTLSLDWRSLRSAAALAGQFVWRGEPIRVAAALREPLALMRDGASSVEGRLAAAPFSLSFDGRARRAGALAFDGSLALRAPSLRALLAWLGYEVPPGEHGFGAATLTAEAEVTTADAVARTARLDIDGNAAAGGLRLVFGEVPQLSGTLAAESFDATPYLRAFVDWQGAGPSLGQTPLAAGDLGSLVLDLRLSAGTVRLGPLAARQSAASILLRDGRLEIAVANAILAGGPLTGVFALQAGERGEGALLRVRFSASALDLAGLPQLLPGLGTRGIVTIAADLAAQGTTLGALLASLEGTLAVSAAESEGPDLGFAALAEALASGATPAVIEPQGGTTRYDRVSLDIVFGDGAGRVREARAATAGFEAAMSGVIDLATGTAALAGRLATPDGAGHPFILRGALPRPTLSLGGMP